jgi:hypothetical protein
MLKNYKDLKGTDKVFRKQTLESLTPGTLEPYSPTKSGINEKYLFLLKFETPINGVKS